MGLFRRNNDDAEQIAALKEEIRSMRERLDEADAAKARLEARADASDASKAALEERVGAIDTANQQLSSRAGDVDSLTSQVRELAERMTPPPALKEPTEPPPPPPAPDTSATDRRVDEIEQRMVDLGSVNERLDALSTAVARQAQHALAADDAVDAEMIGDMANRLEDLSAAVATHGTQLAATRERVDAIEPGNDEVADDDGTREAIGEMRQQLGQMAERMSSLDRRLTNVSTELANQLTELSRDIDEMAEQTPPPTLPPPRGETEGGVAGAVDEGAEGGVAPVAGGDIDIGDLDTDELELRLAEKFDMAIDEVRSSQERLAAEQARYEIKFREDLADLAERLRRPRMS